MRLFTLIDFHHLLLGLFLGLAAAIVIYLAFRYGGGTGGSGTGGQSGNYEEYPEGLRIGSNPVPPVLVFVFIGFGVWFIFYVIFFGILGKPV